MLKKATALGRKYLFSKILTGGKKPVFMILTIFKFSVSLTSGEAGVLKTDR